LSLAVLQIVLHQYTGETDILVAMPVAGRASVELEEVIGLFANLVVVRTDLSGDRPFLDLLREVRNTVLEALTNQYLPFERLVETLHPSRSLAQNPVFQALFASVKAAAPWKSFGGLEARPYNVEASAAAFDLTVSCIEDSPDAWWLRAEFRTDLFNYGQIEGLLDHYVRLLSSVAARLEVRLAQLDRPSGWPVGGPWHSREAVSRTGKILSYVGTLPRDAAKTDPAECRPRMRDQSTDRLEETLADLWIKVLGVHPPAAASNFFELGGHSLLAVRLASEIGRMYGTNFPVSLVFQAPTIDSMARRLRAQVSSASSVIAVQEDGSLPPFFCGGSIHQFVDLSRVLGSDQPFFQLDVFALQQHRLFANEPLYASVPDLAERFKRDILSIQPAGPFFLGGMCEGGIVALEIALQLQDEGREVALLAEFDTPVNGYWRQRWIDWLQHSWSLVYSGQLVPRMCDHMRSFITVRVKKSPEDETYAHILTVTWEAVRAYCPNRVFEGEIQLFRAPRAPTWFREDVSVGWRTRASQGIRVHDVVGDHFKMFCDPLSQRIIAGSIARTRSRSAAE
jgi:thioesterase domain-containing protein